MPIDFGTHHCLNSSGLVHASNTMRGGPLKVRVTTSSRSDFRSTVVRFFIGVASLSLLASIDLLLPVQFLDNLVQLVEACVPELAIPFDPGRLFLQSARADLAGPQPGPGSRLRMASGLSFRRAAMVCHRSFE